MKLRKTPAEEYVEPRRQMVSRHGERIVKRGDIKLLPVSFVILELEVIFNPIERIGKHGILGVRAIAQKIELALETDALDLRDSIAQRLERVACAPHEHKAQFESAAAINPFVA